MKQLLQELKFTKIQQIKLICDNQATLHIASNPVFHTRSKHIEIACHFIREKILSGDIATSYVKLNDQLTDIFTKSLGRVNYIYNKLRTYNLYALAWGGVLRYVIYMLRYVIYSILFIRRNIPCVIRNIPLGFGC